MDRHTYITQITNRYRGSIKFQVGWQWFGRGGGGEGSDSGT